VEPARTRFLRVNAAMCKFPGYSEEELLVRTVLDVTHPEDRGRRVELGRRLACGESDVFDTEQRYIRKDGRTVWARVTVNVVREASGRPLRNAAVVQDINARKQAEQELQASKDRLQLAQRRGLGRSGTTRSAACSQGMPALAKFSLSILRQSMRRLLSC
jgi:PAS domain S-box-containing protein